jgi:hypothetical protein
MNVLQPTHKQAVRRMALWLRNSSEWRCPVVMAELATQNNETPDVLGFYGNGGSVLIECKVSRADFLADRAKSFRHYEETGMGDLRMFAAPPGIITVADLPEGWGYLEMREAQIRKIAEPVFKSANKTAEVKMLMSSIRRLEIATAVFVRVEDAPTEVTE